MNEARKKRYTYLHNEVSLKKETATILLLDVKGFAKQDITKANDWISLNNIIKQLGNPKATYPRKVLRSMLQRFISIKQQYKGM